MEDKITVVGGHAIGERDLAKRLPVGNGVSLPLGEESKAGFFPALRYGYLKAESPLRLGIPLVKDLGQDFMAHICFVDHRLSRSGFEAQKGRGMGRCMRGLPQFRNGVDLPDRGHTIHEGKDQALFE
jgi:hypothetical protein